MAKRIHKVSPAEMRRFAIWRGQAAKAWWQELSDKERAHLQKRPAEELFILGWMACRQRAFNHE
jgi:hypothetical protein